MSEYLLASDILSADDLKYVDELVPEWPKNNEPGVIRLRQLDAGESMEMSDAMNESPRSGMFIILVYTARDPQTDQKLFPLPEDEKLRREQLAKYVGDLKRKSMIVLNRLQWAAMKVNNMGPRARTETKNDSSEAAIAGSPIASLES
jgi:hypothetical protein